ncbi:MAG: hypothetical protein FWC68_01635, partial [Oscillospiraceae bacterium]|nr:hypothetical protein [Oscillospiraceae bacterium]
RIIYPDGQYVRYEYNLLDQITAVVDRTGRRTTYTYDQFGRLSRVIRPNRTITEYTYNEQGRLAAVINKTRDGQTISEFHYEYNADGQIIQELAINGRLRTKRIFKYDAIGQLIGYIETGSNGLLAVAFTYDEAGNRISRQKQIGGMGVGNTEITHYEHNELNQLTRRITVGANDSVRPRQRAQTTEFTYDLNGNLIEQAQSNGTITTYTYNVENRLTAVRKNDVLLMSMVYDGRGERAFSVNRRIAHYDVGVDDSVDPDAEDATQEENPDNLPRTGLGRFSLFWYGFAQSIASLFTGFNQALQVIYSDFLNRNWHRFTENFRNNNIVETTREIYDIREEYILKGEEEPDIEDLILIPIAVSHHQRNEYDLVEYINDITFENTQVLMTYTNRRASSAYTYGIERLTHEDLRMGTMHHYMHDGRGSVANLTPQARNGHMVRYSYDPFGNETRIGFTRSRFGYNAEHTDLTGLQYLRARYYNPNKGRFTSEDPFRGFLDLPISQNRYTYVHNNPINHIDPTGNVAALLAGAMAAPLRQPAPTLGGTVARAAIVTAAPVVARNQQIASLGNTSGIVAKAAMQAPVNNFNRLIAQGDSIANTLEMLDREFQRTRCETARSRLSLEMAILAQQLRDLCATATRIEKQLLNAGHKNLQPVPNRDILDRLPGVHMPTGPVVRPGANELMWIGGMPILTLEQRLANPSLNELYRVAVARNQTPTPPLQAFINNSTSYARGVGHTVSSFIHGRSRYISIEDYFCHWHRMGRDEGGLFIGVGAMYFLGLCPSIVKKLSSTGRNECTRCNQHANYWIYKTWNKFSNKS